MLRETTIQHKRRVLLRGGISSALAGAMLAGCMAATQLRGKVDIGVGTLSQLPPGANALVRTTAAAAAETVLKQERDTGWPDETIDWQDGHCVLLAWLERRPMSRAPDPGPPSAVYLVRLVAADGPGITWVMVDATTGAIGAAICDPLKAGCAT